MRINQFLNIPVLESSDARAGFGNSGSVHFHGFYIPGSISLNNIACALSGSGGNKTITVRWALYSQNANTFSLANSASQTFSASTSFYSWITMVTSATQDITPGIWYFAFGTNTGGSAAFSMIMHDWATVQNNPAGVFVRGRFSTGATGFAASFATSDAVKESGTVANNQVPYILITA